MEVTQSWRVVATPSTHKSFFDIVLLLYGNSADHLVFQTGYQVRRSLGEPLQEWKHESDAWLNPSFKSFFQSPNGLWLVYYPYEILRPMSLGEFPKSITLDFSEPPKGTITEVFRSKVSDTSVVFKRQVGSAFVRFYESILTDIRAQFGPKSAGWPMLFDFARCLRNAFAHNDHWLIPDAYRSVNWRHWSKSAAHNGEPVLYAGDGFTACG